MSELNVFQKVRPRRLLSTGWFLPPVLALFIVLFVFAAAAQAMPCGDANGDDAANVGDIVYLINYVFKSGPPPAILSAGDVNGDGEVNVGDAVSLINWIFKSGPSPDCPPGGGLIGQSGCKSFLKGDETPPDQDCLDYQYDGAGVLSLQHINAGFNCCPEEIIVDIVVEGDQITIIESEIFPICNCDCLFDLDIEVHFLEPGQYTIHVVEIYLTEGDEPLELTVDLSSVPSGRLCVTRDHYPWGEP